MGLSKSSLTQIITPLSFSSHCKVSCDSPCCQSLCGENNHCIFNIGTHEYISDSDSEDTDNNFSRQLNLIVIIYIFVCLGGASGGTKNDFW